MFYVYIFCPMLEIALHYPSTPLANVIDNALLCLFILKLSPTLFSCTKWWDCTLQQSCYACLLSATNLTKSHFIKARSQLIYGPVYVLSVSQGSVFELEALQLKKKKKTGTQQYEGTNGHGCNIWNRPVNFMFWYHKLSAQWPPTLKKKNDTGST